MARTVSRVLLRAAVLWLALLGTTGAADRGHPPASAAELTLGVVPFFTPIRMGGVFDPVADSLGKALGRPVRFQTSSTFDRYFERLAKREYDITLLHAFFYVVAVDQYGYLPVARMTEPFSGLIVVPEASPARALGDLRGATIATPPAYLPTVHLARRAMRDGGIDPEIFHYRSFRTVDSCLQQMVIGSAQACICPPFLLRAAETRMKIRFRRLLETATIPSLTFVVHRRVAEDERRRLRDAIVGWSGDPQGQRMVKAIGTSAFVEARDAEYEGVRRLVKSLDMPWLPSRP